MRDLSSAVTATASPAGAGGDGSPAAVRAWAPRRRGFLRVFVKIRWLPQITTGRIGTPASIAIRAAPVLNSLRSNDCEIVASGKTPTISPSASDFTADW